MSKRKMCRATSQRNASDVNEPLFSPSPGRFTGTVPYDKLCTCELRVDTEVGHAGVRLFVRLSVRHTLALYRHISARIVA